MVVHVLQDDVCKLFVYLFCVHPLGKPAYLHMGEEVDGVDMRAEVGLLSRNILIRGEMEPTCYGNEACKFFSFDTFGGHFKVHPYHIEHTFLKSQVQPTFA